MLNILRHGGAVRVAGLTPLEPWVLWVVFLWIRIGFLFLAIVRAGHRGVRPVHHPSVQ